MVFTSHLFLFYFLPLTLLAYFLSPRRLRSLTLALTSYVFYGWANPPWALLMLASTSIDYACGLALVRLSGLPSDAGQLPLLPRGGARTRGQKLALALSMVGNLALLAYFKYAGFAVENLNRVAAALGLGEGALPSLHVVLPVGISFYTFQSMSYAIDVYRGEARAMRSSIDFCCFESFYPQLVAGPIVRYADIEQQIRSREHTLAKFARGVALFSLGMGKKVLIANPLGFVADAAFGANALHAPAAWYGLCAYTFQIYFDFSGYSDMAVGLALMIGFTLVRNFDAPFLSESITELWTRWHISLSSWLRDYLYIPLGGNRRGRARTYVNLMMVMLLGGLWHGASWNFVIWGGIHGLLLAQERALGRSLYGWLPRALRMGSTFGLFALSLVFFRAESLPRAWRYLKCLAGLGPGSLAADTAGALLRAPLYALTFAAAAALVWLAPQTWEFSHRLSRPRVALCGALLVASILLMWTQDANPFLYFRF